MQANLVFGHCSILTQYLVLTCMVLVGTELLFSGQLLHLGSVNQICFSCIDIGSTMGRSLCWYMSVMVALAFNVFIDRK